MSDMLEKAMKRPLDWGTMDARSQAGIDGFLGIIDWDPTPEEVFEYADRRTAMGDPSFTRSGGGATTGRVPFPMVATPPDPLPSPDAQGVAEVAAASGAAAAVLGSCLRNEVSLVLEKEAAALAKRVGRIEVHEGHGSRVYTTVPRMTVSAMVARWVQEGRATELRLALQWVVRWHRDGDGWRLLNADEDFLGYVEDNGHWAVGRWPGRGRVDIGGWGAGASPVSDAKAGAEEALRGLASRTEGATLVVVGCWCCREVK